MENLKAQLRFLQEIKPKEIIEKAEEQAQKILDEAKVQAEKIKSQKMQEVSEKLQERETAEIALSNLEGKKKLSNVKFQLLEEAITKSRKKLQEASYDQGNIYKKSLERLIIEAATQLKGTELEILTNAKDKKLVDGNLREMETKLSKIKNEPVNLQVSEETLNVSGGAIVRTKDEKQFFNNTIDARISKLRQEMSDKVLANLFGDVED